jgi:phosphonoacetate hydrolase
MINVNGTLYKDNFKTPSVIVCVDGFEPAYLYEAIKVGATPNLERFQKEGYSETAKSVIPSFTNPNNVAIITGTQPDINGIPGNWIYDRRKRLERALDSPGDIKCDTILERFHSEGVKVASVTTKDKLRLLLGEGWDGINISAELAYGLSGGSWPLERILKEATNRGGNEILTKTDPWMYTERPSLYALDLGLDLMESKGPYRPDILYITLTDYIPHRFAPGSLEANRYFMGVDKRLGELDAIGCRIGVTGDHGMKAKHFNDGTPRAVWIDDELDRAGIKDHRTILPITDKYSAHHGSLGGFAWVHTDKPEESSDALIELEGVESVLMRDEASKKFHLPADIIGDIVIFGDIWTVFGTEKRRHDLIPKYLRSHGSLHEQNVPFVLNKKLDEKFKIKDGTELRNFQIFEYVLNGTD